MNDVLAKFDAPTRHILDGTATLFLGAGISFLSKNKRGQLLPDGDGLKQAIEHELQLPPSRHKLDKLANHFRAKRGPAPLYDLLIDRLIAASVDPQFADFLCRNWRRVYTTNYDNAVELACERRRPRKAYTLADKAASVDDGAVVHLNGFIRRLTPPTIDNDLVLSDRSQATSTLLQSPWINVFTTDLRVSRSVIFAGYSLADLDIARILVDEKSLRKKLYFVIAPDADEIEIDALSTYGEVFPVGIGALFDRLSQFEKTYSPAAPKAGFTSLIDLSETPGARTSIPATLVDNQLIYGEPPVEQIMAGTPIFDSVPYLIPRTEISTAAVSVVTGRARDLVITGGVAAGKTFAGLQVAQQLLSAGYKVYQVADGRKLDSDLDRLSKVSDRVCLLVDGYRRYIAEIRRYLAQRNSLHTIVLTERSANHEIVWSSIESSLPEASLLEVSLERLDDVEIEGFDGIVNFAGLYPEQVAGRRSPARRQYIATTLDRSLYRLLLEVVKSKRVQEEIRKLLAPLEEDEETRVFFTTAFIVSALGLSFWINDWQAFSRKQRGR